MPLNVCEIFYSLQGESSYAGLPCIFIRLSGCNLNCTYCDTRYAQHASNPMTIARVLDTIAPFACPLVEITGGEPLLQEQTPELAQALIDNGYTVLIETNGSISIASLPDACIRIMDIKCPSSGEAAAFLPENISLLSGRDEVKFVVGSKQDYAYAAGMIREHFAQKSASTLHISPVFGTIEPARIAGWMLRDHLNARLSIQQHKIIWDPEQRGV